MIKNVFLDRDGTVIYDKHYQCDPAGIELLPGALEGLRSLGQRGLRLFLVTNQSGIGRSLFSEADYLACHRRLLELLAAGGVTLADAAFCPHAPVEEGGVACRCRKPGPGLWEELQARHALAPGESVMVGDKPEDVAFGLNLGFAASVLVLSGKGEASARKLDLPAPAPGELYYDLGATGGREGRPQAVAHDLRGVAQYIERLA